MENTNSKITVKTGMTEHELNVWTAIIYNQIDECNVIIANNDTGSMKERYAKGKIEGLAEAMTWLSIVEDNKRFRKYIAEIETRLQQRDDPTENTQ